MFFPKLGYVFSESDMFFRNMVMFVFQEHGYVFSETWLYFSGTLLCFSESDMFFLEHGYVFSETWLCFFRNMVMFFPNADMFFPDVDMFFFRAQICFQTYVFFPKCRYVIFFLMFSLRIFTPVMGCDQ
jgi:hypothetical protein